MTGIRYENRTRIYGPERGLARWAVYGPNLTDDDGRRMYGLTVTEVLNDNGNRAGWRATYQHGGVTYAYSIAPTRAQAILGVMSRGIAVDA